MKTNIHNMFSKSRSYSDVGFDCRLTVGSLSVLYRSAMHKMMMALLLAFIVGVGQMWGAYTTAPAGTYNLVTDASTLAAGDVIIIAGTNNSTTRAISTTQNSNNRASVEVTLSNNSITLTANNTVQGITLEAGTTSGTFSFNTGDGYLYAASSGSNWLRTEATKSANSSWEISISNGLATVNAQGTNTRSLMRYNHSNNPPIFSCYATNTTTGVLVNIYKKAASGYTVDFAVNNAEYGSVSPSAQLTGVTSGTDITKSNNTVTIGNTTVTANPHAQDANYNYAFSSWSVTDNLTTVTKNITITANFTRTARKYIYRTLCTPPTDPSITVSPASITNLDYIVGQGPSAAQDITLGGSNLTADVTITAPTNFEVSIDGGTSYGNSKTVTQTGGVPDVTTVKVRMKAGLEVGTYGSASTYVTFASSGATTQSVSVIGHVSQPTIQVNPASVTGWQTTVDVAPVTTKTVTVTGLNLKSDITVTLNGTNASDFSIGAVTSIAQATAEGAGGTITISYTGAYNAVADKTANIQLTATDATPVNVPISFSVINDPREMFDLLTDVDDLSDGAKLVLINSGRTYVMNETQNSTNGHEQTNSGWELMNNNTILAIAENNPQNVQVLELVGTSTPNVYALYTGVSKGKYLCNTTSNKLGEADGGTETSAQWLISINGDGNAIIKATGGQSQQIGYNSGASGAQFRCYNSGYAIYAYYKQSDKPSVTLTSSLSKFEYAHGSGPSDSQTFTVSGTNLSASLVVSVPSAAYEVSKNGSNGWGSSVSYEPSTGTVSAQTVYIRLKSGLGANAYDFAAASGLRVTSTGATEKNAALTGEVKYSVTISANNGSYGSVSPTSTTARDAFTVTATPEIGYRVVSGNGGYTVTTGTATVTNNGDNTFSVTPTSNCEITINFEQIVTRTITWKVNGSNYTTYTGAGTLSTSVEDGTKWSSLTLPDAPADNTLSACERTKFMGWSTSQLVGDGHSAPSDLFKSASDDVADSHTISANTTFYAVFAKATGGAETITYNITAKNTLTPSGTAPTGTSSVTLAETYSTSKQMTSGNSQTLTISNWGATKITNLTLSMKSNASSGAGKLRYSTDGGSNYTYLAGSAGSGAAFSDASWYGSWSSSYVDVSKNVNITTESGKTTIIKIESTQNSIYCASYAITYDNAVYGDYATQCCTLKPATGLAVSSTTANSVTLTWTAPSPTTGITKLQVVDGNGTVKVDNIAVGTTTATVTGLTECDPYSFRVVSVGASCETPSDAIDAQPYSGAKTVTYNYHDGTGSPASFTTDCSHTSTTLPTPTKANHRFEGWFTQASGGTRIGGSGDSYTPTANITLHAQWTRVYTLTYVYGADASGSCENGSYAEEETVTTCLTATKTAATLSKWVRSDNSAEITPGGTFTMPASNVTLTAKWIDTEYNLTQTVGANTTKGYTATKIKSGDTPLDMTYTISAANKALPKSVTISGGRASWTLGTDYTWTLSDDKHTATLHINETTISSNMTVTVTEQTRYTITWNQHGGLTYSYYATDDNTLDWGDIDGCGEKEFYGWTADAGYTSHATTPPTMVVKGSTVSASAAYYAIYADAVVPQNPGYEKVTTISAGTYLIAGTNSGTSKAYAGQNGTGTSATGSVTDVTISNDVISSKGSAVEVTVSLGTGDDAGYFAIQTGSAYMKGYNGNNMVVQNDIIYDWSLTNDGQIHSKSQDDRYIQLRSGTPDRICTYAGTQNPCYLFKKQTTTYSNFAKTCTLYDISITTPSGGTVTTSPAAGTGAAGEGQTITVNVTPGDCKYLSALKYNDGSDHAISIASTPYTFTMPGNDVTVTATFSDKTVESIEPNTDSHRLLMQGTSFVGEQIRVNYNSGEKEYLAWDDATLTFSGYNMSELGNQTVSVAYSGTCGNANTSYNIEIVDGVPITFWDCGETTVTKYNVGQNVPVETTIGRYNSTCSGWAFAGWSETKVAANSTTFTPVYNFNASTPKTLYAVYSKEGSTWLSALNVSEMRSGAKYVIVKNYSSGNQYALTNAVDASATNYLDGSLLSTDVETVKDASNNNRYKLKVVPTASMIWIVKKKGSKWVIYSPDASKYLKLTSDGYTQITTNCEDEFTLTTGYNDSEIDAESTNATGKHLSWYNSSPKYWNAYGSAASSVYWMTNNEQFSSTPPCAPRSVTFHGNGGLVTNFEGTESDYDLVVTEVTRDAGIMTPTADMDASDCAGNDWTFMGWIDEEVDVSRVPILTTDLLNDGGGGKAHTITADDEEYWAVYSNEGPAETKYGTISFAMSDFNGSYSSSENTTTKTVSTMGDYSFGYVNIGHASNKGIQFAEDVGEFYNKTSLGKVNSISFTTFSSGDINKLKVYVGDEEKTTDHQLTADEMQNVGSTWTYYPKENESYLYITNKGKGNGSYVCVSGISIDFGRGTTIYATTPVCSTIRLSGDVYVTSRNGIGIMAATPLRVEAHGLDANENVVITSNSSDVYFSTDRNPNFAKASKPTTSVTVTANSSGELSATSIYVHYKPSSDGTGAPADVSVYANRSPADPDIKGEKAIHVRNLPEKIVIAAKVGGAYYALPADMNGATTPDGVLIEVDESNMTAVAPDNCTYTIWPVKTTATEYDRYATNTVHYSGNAYGERVRFSAVNNSYKGLFANNAADGTGINNNATIDDIGDGGTSSNTNPSYEWKITTTVSSGKWSHTLQTDQTNNTKYLRYWTAAAGGPKWGTYASGETNLYLLPVTEYEFAKVQVLEWKANSVVVMYTGTETAATTKVGSNDPSASQTLTSHKLTHGVYELTTDQALTSNAGERLTVTLGSSKASFDIPIIINSNVNASDGHSSQDVVIVKGGKLTAQATSYSYKNVYVYGGGKLDIPTSTSLGVNNIILRAGGLTTTGIGTTPSATYDYVYPQVKLGGTLTSTKTDIKYEYITDNDHWYHLCLPFDARTGTITYPTEYYGDNVVANNTGSWIIKRYDGATRATGNNNAWVDIEADGEPTPTTVTAGHGYIFWAAPKKVTIGGDKQRQKWGIQRITMSTTAAAATTAETANKTVSGLGSYASVEGNSNRVNDQGWNLIGNPYMVNLTGLSSGSIKTGKLVEDGQNPGHWVDNQDGIRYVTIPSDHFETYEAQTMSSFTSDNPMLAGRTFFVQIDGDATGVTFLTANRAAMAPAWQRSAEADQVVDVETGIVMSGAEWNDEVDFWIKDGKTEAYESNADYPKTPNQTNFNIYGVHPSGNLSWVAISPTIAEADMAIGYQVPAAGDYILSLSEKFNAGEIESLLVTDHGVTPELTTDLMVNSYLFTIQQAESNDERFTVSVKLKKPEEQVATDVGRAPVKAAAVKFIYEDKMYIYLNGVIYDATGKRVNTVNK